MKSEMRSLSDNGSVEDIRSSIRLINPQSWEEAEKHIECLKFSLEKEKTDRNRSTVIKMIESKIKSIVRADHLLKY